MDIRFEARPIQTTELPLFVEKAAHGVTRGMELSMIPLFPLMVD